MSNKSPSEYIASWLKNRNAYQTKQKGKIVYVLPHHNVMGGDEVIEEDFALLQAVGIAKEVGGYKYITDEEKDKIAEVFDNLPVVAGTDFQPGTGVEYILHDGIRRRNSWKPFRRVEPADGVWPDISDIHDLYEWLVPDPAERKAALQYIAHMVQRPEERPLWGLMVNGEGRCGKTLAFHYIPALLVCEQVYDTLTLTGDAGITGQRSTNNFWDKMMFVADDYTCDKETVADKLKYLVTTDTFTVWPLYQSCVERRRAFTRFVLINNHRMPMRFGEDGDNRWFVLAYCKHKYGNTEEGKAWTRERCEKIVENLKDPVYLTRVYDYFKNEIDLSDFKYNALPFETEAHKQMVLQSSDPLMDGLNDILDRTTTPHVPDGGPVVTVDYVCDFLYPMGYNKSQQMLVAKYLSKTGLVKVKKDLPPRWELERTTCQFWCLPEDKSKIIGLLDTLEDADRRILTGCGL